MLVTCILNVAHSLLFRAWKEKQAELIIQKDQQSQVKHEQVLKQAKADIDNFYQEYNQKKAKQIQRNRYFCFLFILNSDIAAFSFLIIHTT